MLDEHGYHGIVASDHLTYPRELSSPYPSPTGQPFWPPDTAWPDPWVTIGAMAAVTTNLHFSNAVYIAPARPLLEVAKQVATASVLSGGRVSLGVGAGWMREEFEMVGQRFDDRGARLDEMIQALRALWQGGWVSWNGTHYRIPEIMLEPHPAQPVPILCGGESGAALRRAARYCDGWIGTQYSLDQAAQYVERLRGYRREYGREHDPFDVIVALVEPRDGRAVPARRGGRGHGRDVHAVGDGRRRPVRRARQPEATGRALPGRDRAVRRGGRDTVPLRAATPAASWRKSDFRLGRSLWRETFSNSLAPCRTDAPPTWPPRPTRSSAPSCGRGWPSTRRPPSRSRRRAADAETLREWQRTLHAGSWVGIHWPIEYGGRGASMTQVAIYNEELARAGRAAAARARRAHARRARR